jgi:hypothetical protein
MGENNKQCQPEPNIIGVSRIVAANWLLAGLWCDDARTVLVRSPKWRGDRVWRVSDFPLLQH